VGVESVELGGEREVQEGLIGMARRLHQLLGHGFPPVVVLPAAPAPLHDDRRRRNGKEGRRALTFDDGAGQVPPASSATILVCAIGSTES